MSGGERKMCNVSISALHLYTVDHMIFTYMYIIYIYIYIYVCVYIYMCRYTCITCIYIYMYVNTNILYTYIYTHIYTQTYIHTYAQPFIFPKKKHGMWVEYVAPVFGMFSCCFCQHWLSISSEICHSLHVFTPAVPPSRLT